MTREPGRAHLAALVLVHVVLMPIYGALQVLARIAFPICLAWLAVKAWRWL